MTKTINADGTQEWYLNGKRHRKDGPARILTNGYRRWLINGKDISVQVETFLKETGIKIDDMNAQDEVCWYSFLGTL